MNPQLNMAISQKKAKTKPTGGIYTTKEAKKLAQLGSVPTLTKLDERKTQKVRAIAGIHKTRLLKSNMANVYDPKTKKAKVVKILNIVENPANRHYVRRNILTKGGIISTELGNAKITSRPGQEGTINAVLV